jgi:hypothetical protein
MHWVETHAWETGNPFLESVSAILSLTVECLRRKHGIILYKCKESVLREVVQQ